MDKAVIAQNVRRLREFNGFTQAETALRAGISLSTYWRIEAGRTKPKLKTLIILTDVFNTSLVRLIEPVKHLQAVRFRQPQGRRY